MNQLYVVGTSVYLSESFTSLADLLAAWLFLCLFLFCSGTEREPLQERLHWTQMNTHRASHYIYTSALITQSNIKHHGRQTDRPRNKRHIFLLTTSKLADFKSGSMLSVQANARETTVSFPSLRGVHDVTIVAPLPVSLHPLGVVIISMLKYFACAFGCFHIIGHSENRPHRKECMESLARAASPVRNVDTGERDWHWWVCTNGWLGSL